MSFRKMEFLHGINWNVMSMDQFKNAVDSLQEYPGIVGVMGGEPTLNPSFVEMSRYLYKMRPGGRKKEKFLAPVRDFNVAYRRCWSDLRDAKRGLWSTFGAGYYENLELISDIFHHQCLNDHKNAGLHQALLIPRKELGIEDAEWHHLRDNCWIQNEWSASITPKGAFFCEIAAALDMLFDGPGGWPVEPGWWKRTPAEFGDQLHWCEMCSAALAAPKIAGNEETDIVSPEIWEKLKDRRAWKVIHNRCRVFDTKTYDKNAYTINSTTVPYLSENDLRISQETNASLYPHTIAVLSKKGTAVPAGEKFRPVSEEEAAGLRFDDWLLILSGPLPEATREYICNAVFNPGVIYHAAGGKLIFINRRAAALQGCTELPLTLPRLLKLFPKDKRYRWINWKTPDKVLLRQKFAKRCRDSWNYRSGLLLKKLGIHK